MRLGFLFSTLFCVAEGLKRSFTNPSTFHDPYSHPIVHEKIKAMLASPKIESGFTAPHNLVDLLDSYIAKTVSFWNVTGVSFGLTDGNNVLMAKGYGLANGDTKSPATPSSLYTIASNSKAFTTYLTQLLVQDNLIDIDVPARNFIPELFLTTKEVGADTLTIRDMQSHVTGFPRHDVLWAGLNITSRQDLVRKMAFLQPDKPIRYKTEYNNLMFIASGVALEHAAGDSWENLLVERLLKPLNMTSTFAGLGLVPEELQPSLSIGYDFKRNKLPRTSPTLIGPAGGIVSCVDDLLKWLSLHMKESQGIKVLLNPSIYKKAFLTPSSIFPLLNTVFGTYTLGWWLEQLSDQAVIMHHGGNLAGFTSEVSVLRTSGSSLGYVTLTNQDASYVPNVIELCIIELVVKGLAECSDWNSIFYSGYLQLQAAQAAAQTAFNAKMQQPGNYARYGTDLGKYCGYYSHPSYSYLNITLNDSGVLVIDYAGMYFAELKHAFYETFIGASGVLSEFPVTFLMDGNGDVMIAQIPLEPSSSPIGFTNSKFTAFSIASDYYPTSQVHQAECNSPSPSNSVLPPVNPDSIGVVSLTSGSYVIIIVCTSVTSVVLLFMILLCMYKCLPGELIGDNRVGKTTPIPVHYNKL